MIYKTFIAVLLCLLTTVSAGAQGNREQVELVLMDGTTAIFSSEGFASDKESAINSSCQAVFRRILYDGVEGFNGGEAIVTSGQQTNMWLKDFFTGKNPAYKNFLGGVELIGGFAVSAQGETHCRTHVLVEFAKLINMCRSQGLMEDGASRPIEQRSTQPRQMMQQRPKRSF